MTAALPTSSFRVGELHRWAFTLFVFAGFAAVYACINRGIWLDEFWSMRLGDASVRLATLVEQRWLRDTNPMAANLLYRVAAESGFRDVAGLRLVLNLPAAALLLVTTLSMARASPTRSPFYVVLAILVVALPAFAATFSDFRAYFWQLCSVTVALQYAYRMIVEPSPATSFMSIVPGVLALVAALTLHFVGGFIVSVLVVCILFHFARERDWPRFAAIAVPAALCWSAMLAMFVVQYRQLAQDLDVSWIGTSTPDALAIVGTTLAAALLANPAAAAFALLARRVGGDEIQRERAFVILLATGIAVGAALLLLVNGRQAIIVDRYLLTWQVAVCAIIAVHAGAAVAGGGWRLYVVVGVSALSVTLSAYGQSRQTGWDGTRDFIAASVRNCPETTVHAISPWRLKAGRSSRAAALERPVFDRAYRRLAQDAGFAVAIVPDAARVLNIPAQCPSLLWIEHSGGRRLSDPAALLRAAGLGYAQPARVSMFASDDGVVIAARRR